MKLLYLLLLLTIGQSSALSLILDEDLRVPEHDQWTSMFTNGMELTRDVSNHTHAVYVSGITRKQVLAYDAALREDTTGYVWEMEKVLANISKEESI